MSFGDNLRNIRKDKGYTQEQLAEMLDVSRQAISKWESGSGLPEAETLVLLAKTLEVSLDTLMDTVPKSNAITSELPAQSKGLSCILISVFDGSKVVPCLSVKYDKIAFPARKEPPYILSGIDRMGILGEHSVILGWYENEAAASKELSAILAAMETGASRYNLQYFTPVRFTAFGTAARVE